MKNYLLRNIPPTLWRKVKHFSVDSGESIRLIILKALDRYMKAKGRYKQ